MSTPKTRAKPAKKPAAKKPRAASKRPAKGTAPALLTQAPITPEQAADAQARWGASKAGQAAPGVTVQLSTDEAQAFWTGGAALLYALRSEIESADEGDRLAAPVRMAMADPVGAERVGYTTGFANHAVASASVPDERFVLPVNPPPAEPRHWIGPLMRNGPRALLDALGELAGARSLESYGVNTLSVIGNVISAHVRRAVLLEVLEQPSVDWNLSRASEVLQMGDAGNVTRAIVQLGLEDRLRAARATGKARRGGKRGAAKPVPTRSP